MSSVDPDIWIRLAAGTEPIEGCVSDASGRARPFRGWLELSAIIEEVRSRAPAGLESRPSADGGL